MIKTAMTIKGCFLLGVFLIIGLSIKAQQGKREFPSASLFRHRLFLAVDTVNWDGICERGPDFNSELKIRGKRTTQFNLLCENGGEGCTLCFKRKDDDWYIRLGFRWYLFYNAKLKCLAPAPDNEGVKSFNYLVASNSNVERYGLLAFKFYFKQHLQEDTRIIWFHPSRGVVAMNSDDYTYLRDDFWHDITRTPGSGS